MFVWRQAGSAPLAGSAVAPGAQADIHPVPGGFRAEKQMNAFLEAHPEWEEYRTANGNGTGAVWPKDPSNTGAVVFGAVLESWQAHILHPSTYRAARVAHYWQTIEIVGYPGLNAIRPKPGAP